jgi:phage FluMu gp28-like protein
MPKSKHRKKKSKFGEDYGRTAAMIVSLVGYTKQRKITPKKLALKNVTLKQKDDLLQWLKEYEPKGNGLWLPASK